ncbi:hypothetical protein BOTBODRAFT_48458 [Botryobasidium botryosum FD-172 SS1]|uniref:Uncharacterized protein n=1 Tax=Botryobasidium botryosum (strain FD-172 SS1) TaxID=930990 RepID=A0A067M8S6_BOTB1|nr:hypothetical protein BOTBODRAFT_48458 [Botryobasidium botryosum FD-172 SS1]
MTIQGLASVVILSRWERGKFNYFFTCPLVDGWGMAMTRQGISNKTASSTRAKRIKFQNRQDPTIRQNFCNAFEGISGRQGYDERGTDMSYIRIFKLSLEAFVRVFAEVVAARSSFRLGTSHATASASGQAVGSHGVLTSEECQEVFAGSTKTFNGVRSTLRVPSTGLSAKNGQLNARRHTTSGRQLEAGRPGHTEVVQHHAPRTPPADTLALKPFHAGAAEKHGSGSRIRSDTYTLASHKSGWVAICDTCFGVRSRDC